MSDQPHGNTGNQHAKKPADEAATGHLHIRCKPTDKTQWVRAAQFDPESPGSKLAEWCIRTLNRAAKKSPKSPPKC